MISEQRNLTWMTVVNYHDGREGTSLYILMGFFVFFKYIFSIPRDAKASGALLSKIFLGSCRELQNEKP